MADFLFARSNLRDMLILTWKVFFFLIVFLDNSLHLGRKYARIFVLGHYLFLEAHSSRLGTDKVRVGGQISEHIFAQNGGYYLYNLCFVVCFAW